MTLRINPARNLFAHLLRPVSVGAGRKKANGLDTGDVYAGVMRKGHAGTVSSVVPG